MLWFFHGSGQAALVGGVADAAMARSASAPYTSGPGANPAIPYAKCKDANCDAFCESGARSRRRAKRRREAQT